VSYLEHRNLHGIERGIVNRMDDDLSDVRLHSEVDTRAR